MSPRSRVRCDAPPVPGPARGAGPGAEGGLPAGVEHPSYVEVGLGHHLRPIRTDDVDLDLMAVTGSRERLWRTYGEARGWPPEDLTREQDREDLARLVADMAARRSWTYALLDSDETALLGRVHVEPVREPAAGAEVTWWVVDECVGTELEAALDALVPRWVAEAWPPGRPRPVGR